MLSTAKIEANRENSKLSTGPKTPEGKAASSLNHRTHGLSAIDPVLPTEDRCLYNALIDTVTAEWKPTSDHEQFLIEQIAGARWKLKRVAGMELEMIEALEAPLQVFTDKEKSAAFARLERYRAALERTYHRSIRELRIARKDQFEAKVEQAAEKKYRGLSEKMMRHAILGPIPTMRELNLTPPPRTRTQQTPATVQQAAAAGEQK